MKNYNKEDALKIIIGVALEYEERLKDNHFLIIYSQNNKISAVQVGFRDSNYLHMTGVKSRLSAPVFYDSCIKGNYLKGILKLIKMEGYNRN